MDTPCQDPSIPRRDPRAVRRLRLVSGVAAALAAAIGAAGLASWELGLPALRTAGRSIEMQPNAGAGILALALGLLATAHPWRAVRWLGRAAAALAAALGLATLVEHLAGVDLGLDRLLLPPAGLRGPASGVAGRMGPPAAVQLLVAGAAVLLLDLRAARARSAAQALALAAGPVALLAVVGYAYDVTLLTGGELASAIALPTAVALLLVDVAVLLARPDGGVLGTLAARGSGAALARRMLLYALALPIVLGGAALAASDAGADGAFAVSLLVVATTLVLALLVLRDAAALDRMEEARDRAQAERARSSGALAEALRRAEEARAQAEAARAQAEATSRTKDEFLATLSHELRTPLNAILGWNRLLREASGDPERLGRGLSVVERNGRALAQLLSDLLDISRLARGAIALELAQEEVDLAGPVEAAVQAVRPAADAKGITLSMAVAPDVPRVLGDAARLQQVTWNLLANAVKFTAAGGRVDVRLAHEGGQAVLTVEDTGVGIAAEFLPSLFEPFHQSDGSPSRRFGGLGLGLALAQRLVELHGGVIGAASAGIGRGATFRVALPPAPAAALRPRPSLGGARVLVVDDEDDSRELLLQLLASWGARVAGAASAREALEAVRLDRPELLVSDIAMPGEDGYALVAALRALERSTGAVRVPACALTAFCRAEDRGRVLAAGFDAHLPKPVEPEALLATVQRLLLAAAGAARPAEADAPEAPLRSGEHARRPEAPPPAGTDEARAAG